MRPSELKPLPLLTNEKESSSSEKVLELLYWYNSTNTDADALCKLLRMSTDQSKHTPEKEKCHLE
jgi:hypothetical protein